MIKINIDTANAAFHETPPQEIVRILRGVVHDIERHGYPHTAVLRDINGNKVGFIDYDPEDFHP